MVFNHGCKEVRKKQVVDGDKFGFSSFFLLVLIRLFPLEEFEVYFCLFMVVVEEVVVEHDP